MRRLKWLVPLAVLLTFVLYSIRPYWRGNLDAEASRLMDVLRLKPGMTAAEIGAGGGEMTVLLARRLGPAGTLFSTEIEEKKVDRIRQAVRDADLNNVTVLLGAATKTNLPAGCCDAIFLRKVYHHFQNPSPLTASLHQAVRPGGRVAVIDFAPRRWMFWMRRPQGVPENRGGHGVPPRRVIREMEAAGFVLERQQTDWTERNYCLVFHKSVGTRPGIPAGAAEPGGSAHAQASARSSDPTVSPPDWAVFPTGSSHLSWNGNGLGEGRPPGSRQRAVYVPFIVEGTVDAVVGLQKTLARSASRFYRDAIGWTWSTAVLTTTVLAVEWMLA